IAARDLKSRERAAAPGLQGLPRVVEPDPDGAPLARELPIQRAPSRGLREHRQTPADILFVGGMDARLIADVVDDRDSGVAERGGLDLPFLNEHPVAVLRRVAVVR